MNRKTIIGKYGENVAEKYLLKNKYHVIKRNFYCKMGEIDIIAEKDGKIIFIEVKTRTNLKYGTPAEAVSLSKIKKIKKAAQYYMLKNQIESKLIRFDVIEIYIKEYKIFLNHIKQII